ETGGILTKGFGAGIAKLPFGGKFIASLQDDWIRITGGSADNFATKMLTKAGYNGIIGEVGEERLATLLREATGVSDRKGNPFERIWDGMKEDFEPENLGAEIVTLLAPASVRRGMTLGVSLTKGVSVPTEAEQLDQAVGVGPIQFDMPEDAQGYADRAAEIAIQEDKDVNITIEHADNTVTVEEIAEEAVSEEKPAEDPAKAVKPPSAEVKEVKPLEAKQEAVGKEVFTSVPDEWKKEKTLVDWGQKGIRTQGNRALSAGEGKKTRKTFVWTEDLEEIPTRLPKSTMDFFKNRTDDVWKLQRRGKGEDVWLVPKELVKQLKKELGPEAFKRSPKPERSPKQKLNDIMNSMRIKDIQPSVRGEVVLDTAKELGIPESELTETQKGFIKEFRDEQAIAKPKKDIQPGVGQEVQPDPIAEAERIAIQEEADAGEVGDFLEGIVDDIRPKEVAQPTPTEQEIPEIPEAKRIISKESFDAALKRLGDTTKLKVGFDPQQLKDAAIVGGYLVESGIRKFSAWSADMVKRLGEGIKPHLQGIWDGIIAAQPKVEKPKKAVAIKPRVTPTQKKAEADIRQRGFISSIKTALPDLKVEGTYIPRSTDELSIKAKNLVKDDIQKAEALALKGDSDKSVATASELLKHYNEQAQLATDQVAKDAFYDKAAKIANDIAAKLTEAGRTVQAAIILSRLTPEGQVRFAAREIQRHNEKIEKSKGGLFGIRKKIPELTPKQAEDILTEMKAIEDMPPGEAKAKRFQKLQNSISDLVPTPLFKKLIAIWKAGLLTGIKTSGLNIMSTTANVAAEKAAKIPATIIDKTISIGTGKRTVTVSIKGVKQGTVQGVKRGFDYLVTGYDERNIGVKLDYKRINMGKGKLARALQLYTDGVFRLLGAEDQPFYYVAKVMSLFEQAKVAAINEGLKGKEAQTFIDNLMQDPTEDMVKNASKDAEAAVFQNKTALGDLAKGIQGLGKGAGEIVVPFGRTPSAVAMQIINYSPVGAVKTIIENIGKGKFNQRDFVTGLGRSIVGAIPLVIGAALWDEDMITLDFPKTQKERDLWKLEGRKANSIKVDGRWRTIQSFGPGGNLLVVGGHFRRAFQESGSPSEAMAQAIFGSGKSFTEQTFLQGINQFTAALNDPERSGPRLARGLVS
ncbi:MAG: hypothetical protein JRD69_09940, partial [Deltaproteobacteria bacterium]|nr:hypothetical protein [Deltaproteobacteria bacterium]